MKFQLIQFRHQHFLQLNLHHLKLMQHSIQIH